MLLACVAIIGIGSLLQNALSPDSNLTATQSLTNTALAPAIVVLSDPATSMPTMIIPTPRFGVGSTMISEKDDMVMVYVPAGEFEMGSENRNDSEKPIHTVYLDAYWIDQTEVTNAMFKRFVDETGYETDAEKEGMSYTDLGDAVFGQEGANWQNPFRNDEKEISVIMNYPVVHMSWNDANAYCFWVGRRLPTEAEWEKAASWDAHVSSKYLYPSGDTISCSFANYQSKCVGSTTTVGSYNRDKSPYGVYDVAGNVTEWVADWWDNAHYQNSSYSNPLGPNSGIYRVRRGGSWDGSDKSARSTFRGANEPTYTQDVSGFRCALSASE